MINFLNLEYFLVAADELNFTRAAKQLSISQQSLSNHILNLEKEFGVILFDRTVPLTLTYAGQTLKTRARQLLDLKDEIYRELADIKDFSTGQISIGISHTRGRMILPGILPTYKERFPNIEIKLIEGNSKELDNDLIHGKIDLVIGMLPFMADNVETVPLCEEEILMAIPDKVLEKNFPGKVNQVRASLKKKINLELLKDCPYLMPNKGNRVRTIADDMFHDAQITPNIILETENIETVLALSLQGMGITFYPKMFISQNSGLHNLVSEANSVDFYSLNYNKAHGILAIGYHKDRYLSQATKEFIRMTKEKL